MQIDDMRGDIMSKVPRTMENFKHCKCLSCPSYTTKCKLKEVPRDLVKMVEGVDKADHIDGMFCAFGKSECITEIKSCICMTCKNAEKYGLVAGFYCVHGSAE